MISVSVFSLALLVIGGLVVNCQYIQDGDLPLNTDSQDINHKLDEIENLIRSSYEPDSRPNDTPYKAIDQGNRREILERFASGVVRGVPEAEADQFRALLQLINGEGIQDAVEPIDPQRSFRDDVNVINWPDDQNSGLLRPVNEPEEFETRLGYAGDAPKPNADNLHEQRQLLMDLLNQTRLEYDLAASEDQTEAQDAGQKSASQHDIDHLVDRLDQWINQQANRANLEENLKQQEQHQQELQVQPRDNSEDQPGAEREGGGSASYGGSEYIDQPLAVAGHQFVQGGAGEGRQLLGPEGTYENVQVIKTDTAIPSYCDPPNPCPLGYTAKDGCLEEFVNSASFSREYQAQQKCSCDNEHSLFNCAASISSSQQDQQQQKDNSVDDSNQSSLLNLGSKLDALARTVQNRFGNLAFVQRLIGKQQEKQEQDSIQMSNDDSNSNYLIRSARKLSALDMHHKVELD